MRGFIEDPLSLETKPGALSGDLHNLCTPPSQTFSRSVRGAHCSRWKLVCAQQKPHVSNLSDLIFKVRLPNRVLRSDSYLHDPIWDRSRPGKTEGILHGNSSDRSALQGGFASTILTLTPASCSSATAQSAPPAAWLESRWRRRAPGTGMEPPRRKAIPRCPRR